MKKVSPDVHNADLMAKKFGGLLDLDTGSRGEWTSNQVGTPHWEEKWTLGAEVQTFSQIQNGGENGRKKRKGETMGFGTWV